MVDIDNSIPIININHLKKEIIMSSAEMHAFVMAYFTFIVSDLIESSDKCMGILFIIV